MASHPRASRRARSLSELIGTFLLVLVGPGTAAAITLAGGVPTFEAFLIIGLAFGGIVAIVILFLGRISGAHINPALTIAHAVAGKTSRDMLGIYVAFQVVGALLGGFTLKLIFSPYGLPADLGTTRLASGVSISAGILLEIAGTFILAMAGFVASSRIHAKVGEASFIGLTLFLIIQAIGPLTNASLNPARSLGPAVASGYLTNLYVYWIGPPVGGLIAGLVFRFLEKPKVG
jgi:MIP family channel proteins